MNSGEVRRTKIPDIVTTFYEEFESDDENESREMIRFYEHASMEQRQGFDQAIIYLCGWTLGTLIEKAIERNNYIE